jgi:hypothetical protein
MIDMFRPKKNFNRPDGCRGRVGHKAMEGATMRRIPVLLLAALLILGLVPIAASAQTTDEAAAIAAFEEALDGFECLDFDGCVEDIAEVKAALAALKALFPGLDYAALDAAIADLDAAIVGGDLDEVKAAFDAVGVAGAAVAADAAAAAGGTTTTIAGTTTTIAEVVTDIPDGGSGPNVALLGAAALLVLLSGAALALRVTADRR